MSLEHPKRQMNLPYVIARALVVVVVFIGVLAWQRAQNPPQPAEQSATTLPQGWSNHIALPPELREGIAVALIWDVQTEATQTSTPATIAWRDAEARRIHQQLKRLTQFASENSEVPLRVALFVAGSNAASTTGEARLHELLPMDAPAAGQDVEQALENVQPDVHPQLIEAILRSQLVLTQSGLSERHLIIVGSENATSGGILKQMQAGDAVTHVHYIKRNIGSDKNSDEMDAQFKVIFDQILTPIR